MSTARRYPADIFTESDASPDTLANLGPLAPLAGTWKGRVGQDDHAVVEGAESDAFIETFDLQPIDRQTNGPQLFYGLRYHQHITKPGDVETFHDQVGYLLWEPAAKRVLMTLAIPRGQVAMAEGPAESGATEFTLAATSGDPHAGIVTNDFLDRAFHTVEWRFTVRVGPGDTWSYDEVTVLDVEGRPAPFEHRDTSTLVRVALPTRNPLAEAARTAGILD
jgi:hypothetical protein